MSDQQKINNIQEARQKFHKENPEYDLNLSDERRKWFLSLSKNDKKEFLEESKNAENKWREENAPHLQEQIEIERLERDCIIQLPISRRKSTEKAVEIIEKENHFYAIADDKNPELWVYDRGIYVPNAGTIIEARTRQIYEEAYTTTLCNEIISKIRAQNYIPEKEFFNAEPTKKICLENGILNLETLELEPHNPQEIHFTRIPIKYDPGVKCPSFEKHLHTVMAHEEDIPVMQEIFGWFLRKEYKPEKAVMLLGSGRNGKGKTIEVMKRFLGMENVAGVPLQDLDERPFCLNELHKKLANIGADLPKNALAETGRFKNLTGGDYVTADRKHQSMISFVNYAKMVYAANTLPLTYDVTHAFFARWIIIDFPFKFYPKEEYERLEDKTHAKVRDIDIIEKIATEEELRGILNWAIEGYQRLKERGGFTYSKNTEEVKRMWIRRSDSFAAFCMDNIKEKWDGKIEKSELKRVYSLYCRKHKTEMVSDQKIKRYLAENYGASDAKITRGDSQVYSWKGIAYIQGIQDIHGFCSNREISFFQSEVKPMDTLDTLDIFIKKHVKDNKKSLIEKFGEERVYKWLRDGVLIETRPGTLRPI